MTTREPIRKEASGRYVVVLDTAAPGERRRQTKRRFATYRDARAWLTSARQQVTEGRYIAPQKVSVGAVSCSHSAGATSTSTLGG